MVLVYDDANAVILPLLLDCRSSDRASFKEAAEKNGLCYNVFKGYGQHIIYLRGERLKAGISLDIIDDNFRKKDFSILMGYLEQLLNSDFDLEVLSLHFNHKDINVIYNKDGALDIIYHERGKANRIYITNV